MTIDEILFFDDITDVMNDGITDYEDERVLRRLIIIIVIILLLLLRWMMWAMNDEE